MKKAFNLYFIVISLGFISCSFNQQENDFIIDSSRVGDIKLCDKISDIIKKYPNSIAMEFEGDEGVTWKGQKILLAANEWILIEASWLDSTKIWRISTNSTKYSTVNGYKVGDKISKIKNNKDIISYYESEMGFQLESDKLNFGFELESKYMDDFYKKINDCNDCPDYMNLFSNEASIQNIIISGECKKND